MLQLREGHIARAQRDLIHHVEAHELERTDACRTLQEAGMVHEVLARKHMVLEPIDPGEESLLV